VKSLPTVRPIRACRASRIGCSGTAESADLSWSVLGVTDRESSSRLGACREPFLTAMVPPALRRSRIRTDEGEVGCQLGLLGSTSVELSTSTRKATVAPCLRVAFRPGESRVSLH
jgi:hypothetical protein